MYLLFFLGCNFMFCFRVCIFCFLVLGRSCCCVGGRMLFFLMGVFFVFFAGEVYCFFSVALFHFAAKSKSLRIATMLTTTDVWVITKTIISNLAQNVELMSNRYCLCAVFPTTYFYFFTGVFLSLFTTCVFSVVHLGVFVFLGGMYLLFVWPNDLFEFVRGWWCIF